MSAILHIRRVPDVVTVSDTRHPICFLLANLGVAEWTGGLIVGIKTLGDALTFHQDLWICDACNLYDNRLMSSAC
jgi:hypothetical protein